MDIITALDLIIAILFTATCYCLIPIILRFTLIKKRELSKKAITGIAVTNSVIICALFKAMEFIFYGYPDMDGVWYAPAVFYSLVTEALLISGNNKYHKKLKTNSKEIIVYDSKYSYNPPPDTISRKENMPALNTESTESDTATNKALEKAHPVPKKAKKPLPKSTKVCICIIIAMVIGILIGGIATYYYVTYDYYNHAYDVGYDDGYLDGGSDSDDYWMDLLEENDIL